MLSEKTLAEMQAGAKCLADKMGEGGLDGNHLAALIRTQERMKLLRTLETQGKIKIELVIRPRTSEKDYELNPTYHIIRVGKLEFRDEIGEYVGAFPSEVLTAQVVLALDARQGDET